LYNRQRKKEVRTRPRLRLGPQAAAVMLNDAPADGEPDSVTRICAHTVKPLEYLKNAVAVLRIETDSVVRNRK
jgi:hypothetical protein